MTNRRPARLDRRAFLRLGATGALAAAGGGVLSGCGRSDAAESQIVLSSWNIPANLKQYRSLTKKYASRHGGVDLGVSITGSGDFNQWFTTLLAAGNAPDIIRITPQTFGRYAENGGLVDLRHYLPDGYGDDFLDVFWAAARSGQGVMGLPQQTDTFATFYRTDIAEKIGVELPRTIDDAWRWDEFMEVAREVKKATGAYAMTYGFTGPNTAYRWLPILYMHGGSLLADDMRTPTITEDAGVEALAWSQRWFREGLMPMSNTIKNSKSGDSESLLANRQVGLMLHGSWIMAGMPTFMKDEDWDVTYMVRDVGQASDLGGNILAVTASSARPEEAAEFVAYVCDPANMAAFCKTGLMLPVRKSLVRGGVDYSYRAKAMRLFVEQATRIPEEMVRLETMPSFNSVNQLLADYLDLCFIGEQTPKETARSIAEGLRDVLG